MDVLHGYPPVQNLGALAAGVNSEAPQCNYVSNARRRRKEPCNHKKRLPVGSLKFGIFWLSQQVRRGQFCPALACSIYSVQVPPCPEDPSLIGQGFQAQALATRYPLSPCQYQVGRFSWALW